VEALQDLEKSLELNDNRAVYRSRLLLDEDRATQSAGLARIYEEVGFKELALIEGAKALAINPDNYAAHLFLADVYSRLPNEEIARESEQLQFRLSQPEIISPISALRPDDTFSSAYPRTGLTRSIVPTQLAFNEFSSLFERNSLSLYVDALGGQRSTGGEQLIASGIQNAVSFNLAQAHFETAGFDENQELRQDAYLGMIQGRVDPTTSVQAEIRQTDTRRGDSLFVDPATIFPVELDGRVRSGRIGGSHRFSADSNVIVSAIYQTRDLSFFFPSFGMQTLRKDQAFNGEAQWSYSMRPFNVVAGAGHVQGSADFVGQFNQHIASDNVYAYGNFEAKAIALVAQAGLSGEFLRETGLYRRRVSPKLGWPESDQGTTLRAALLDVVKRPFVADQTMEPRSWRVLLNLWRTWTAQNQRLIVLASISGLCRMLMQASNLGAVLLRCRWYPWVTSLGGASCQGVYLLADSDGRESWFLAQRSGRHHGGT